MDGRPTEGMPDMMPKGTVDNPPQKEPQNIPDRMVDQPYEGTTNMESNEKAMNSSHRSSKISDKQDQKIYNTECGCHE